MRRHVQWMFYAWAMVGELCAAPVNADNEGVTEVNAQSAEQLFQLLTHELEVEDRRPSEAMLKFSEFQDAIELDCHSRLIYLLNRTALVRDSLIEHQDSLHGVSGLFWQVLLRFPDENTWIWSLLASQHSVLQKVHAYMARVAFLALERQQCLLIEVRRVLLAAVIRWKELHADLSAMWWGGFAFGSYRTEAIVQEVDESMRNMSWPATLLAANNWVASTRLWIEQHTKELYEAMVREEPASIQEDHLVGASRLHHQDEIGMFVPLEYLRRKVFGQWALDKGLLRGILRHVLKPSQSLNTERPNIADFGAGGGQYCTWLNETGLVDAFAFDGTPKAAEITAGAVQVVNLVEDLHLWRTFDWALSLEVGEHIPKQYAQSLLRNIKRHIRHGLIMSWSDDWEGIGHVNCLSKDEFIATVQREIGLVVDWDLTEKLRQACEIDYIARTIAVFRTVA